MSNRVEKQARASAGLIEYQLQADPVARRFWTVSAWTDPALRADFVQAEPHVAVLRVFPTWAAPGYGSAEWTSDSTAIDWRDVDRRLREAGATGA